MHKKNLIKILYVHSLDIEKKQNFDIQQGQ